MKPLIIIKKSTELGNPFALLNLGNCFENGEGVDQNFQSALDNYQKAAALGNSDAKLRFNELQKSIFFFNFIYFDIV